MCSIIFYVHNEYTRGDLYVNNVFFSVTLQLKSADKSQQTQVKAEERLTGCFKLDKCSHLYCSVAVGRF